MKTRLACAALLAIAVSGCAAMGPDFQRPAAPSASGYAMTGDKGVSEAVIGAPSSGPWWKSFGPPMLDQVISQALAGNPTLSAANATLAQARASLAAARGGLLPTLDANAGGQKERLNLASFGFGNGPAGDQRQSAVRPLFRWRDRQLSPGPVRRNPPPDRKPDR